MTGPEKAIAAIVGRCVGATVAAVVALTAWICLLTGIVWGLSLLIGPVLALILVANVLVLALAIWALVRRTGKEPAPSPQAPSEMDALLKGVLLLFKQNQPIRIALLSLGGAIIALTLLRKPPE